jgi:hypothetical protein
MAAATAPQAAGSAICLPLLLGALSAACALCLPQNFLALVPLALILGDVTEDLALRCGVVVSGWAGGRAREGGRA